MHFSMLGFEGEICLSVLISVLFRNPSLVAWD
jgi:hypothetical protein